MSKTSRYRAFLAYLLSLPGALFMLLARRDDAFAVYHAQQSLALVVAAVAAPLVWALMAWALAWIPLAGPMLGVILFALLIAVYIGLGISWIVGLVYAWQGRVKTVPLVGTWVGRLPRRAEPSVAVEAEAIETVIDTS